MDKIEKAAKQANTHNFIMKMKNVVQEALERVSNGRRCIVIAHHLSSIQNSDQILVMNDGAIAQFDTRQELLHQKGIYASFIEMQNIR
ncbi:ATP-dependent translocase ABCB1 [Dirofilaria immitis]